MAGIVAIYFIVLPIIFTVHHAEHDHSQKNVSGNKLHFEEQSITCALCHFVIDQTGLVQNPVVFFLYTNSSILQLISIQNLIREFSSFTHLRGPPSFLLGRVYISKSYLNNT